MRQIATIPANVNPHYLIKPSDVEAYHIRFIRRGSYQESGEVQIFTIPDWDRLTSDPDWMKKAGIVRYSIVHDPLKKKS